MKKILLAVIFAMTSLVVSAQTDTTKKTTLPFTLLSKYPSSRADLKNLRRSFQKI